ncbi:MAG: recombination mediator RecR [Patescibacteria group bacterium]|nr:MAG: recombination mediator RecR [Patescibacteria group bacterium]
MSRFPASIENLIQEFKKLPGIGEKTAERFVFHLLGRGREAAVRLGDAIFALERSIIICARCRSVSEADPCRICRDPSRRDDELCIVADQQGLSAIERTGSYKGKYFVLGGLLSPIEGVTPETLGIDALDQRLQGGSVRELLLAVNPTIEGEATMAYLSRRYAASLPRVTRLARGLPRGADLEYADEVTLSDALVGRREMK